MDHKQNKQKWRSFFDLEKSFYEYVTENCEALHGTAPKFILVGEQLKAPKYIRWIARLNQSDSTEFKQRLELLRAAYREAVGDDFTTYPVRFCDYLEGVEQINVTVNEAFRSEQLKSGFFTLIEEHAEQDNFEMLMIFEENLKEVVKTLDRHRIESTIKVENSLLGMTHYFLRVRADDVATYFQTNKIQMRTPSGFHYRARIRYVGDSAGQRMKYGFTVVDQNSPCHVVISNDQAPRPHSLVKQGRELFLPLDYPLTMSFFDKS